MAFSVAGKRVIVAGGGRSGVAAAELLVSRGAHVTLSDTSAALQGGEHLRALGVTVDLGPHRSEAFRAADLIVLSPGVPPTQDAVVSAREAGVAVIGEVELASRFLQGPVIAITGTKGKSTTTTLTALSGQVAATHPGALHVVEVSSFQLESIETFHPWIAVLLNLSPDHLDRHASFEEYAAAKARIFTNQAADDWAVVNADDAAALELARGARARRFDFGLDSTPVDGVTVEGGVIVRRDGGTAAPLMPLTSVRLPGRHLLSDVLAATAVGCLAGIPAAAMRRAVEDFRGLEHALEQVADIQSVR